MFFIIQIACGLTRVTNSLTARLYSFRGLSINGIEEGRATALAVACLRSEYRRRILIKLEFRQSLCVVVIIVSISTTRLNECSLMENFAWRRSYQMFVVFLNRNLWLSPGDCQRMSIVSKVHFWVFSRSRHNYLSFADAIKRICCCFSIETAVNYSFCRLHLPSLDKIAKSARL